MRRAHALASLALALCAGLPLSAASATPSATPSAQPAASAPRMVRSQTLFRGQGRDILYALPASPSRSPLPLVIALHGGLGDGEKFERQSALSSLAARGLAAVAFPSSGSSRHWLDGRPSLEGDSDLAFLFELPAIARAEAARRGIPLDLSRVFVAGISNGGLMALRLACQAQPSFRFAGFAAFSAGLPASLESSCRGAPGASVLLARGTDDRLMPFSGGPVPSGGGIGAGGIALSASATSALFAANAGCSPDPSVSALPDLDPSDGTRSSRSDFRSCRAGARVSAVDVHGGGHAWPGSPAARGPIARRLSGVPSNDFRGDDLLWGFFSSLPPVDNPPPNPHR